MNCGAFRKGRALFCDAGNDACDWRWNLCPVVLKTFSESAASAQGHAIMHFSGVDMDSELRKRLDDFFDVGFGKTTGIDTALEITKIYAGSAAADPDKIPNLFVRLVQLFEPNLDVRD
jgi:hypothetical protein